MSGTAGDGVAMSSGSREDDLLREPGAALDRLAAWQDRVEQVAADTRAMSEQLGQLRVTAADEHRMVEVTIDAQGALTDLKLGPRIQRTEPGQVARTILATIDEARRRAAGQAREIIAGTVGPDSPAARAIAAQITDRLDGPGR